jgi:hypothetical protein
MRIEPVKQLSAAALYVAAACLPALPAFVHAEEVVAMAVPQPQRIFLPAMRAGGIPQGQILQITSRGSELVAAPRITLASADNRAVVVVAAAESKPASRLFCAGTM